MRTIPDSIRLAQNLQHMPVVLGQFVQEQHAVMGERNLAGARMAPATTVNLRKKSLLIPSKTPVFVTKSLVARSPGSLFQ